MSLRVLRLTISSIAARLPRGGRWSWSEANVSDTQTATPMANVTLFVVVADITGRPCALARIAALWLCRLACVAERLGQQPAQCAHATAPRTVAVRQP